MVHICVTYKTLEFIRETGSRARQHSRVKPETCVFNKRQGHAAYISLKRGTR